jgi:Ca2+-binding RTX toxin-like protein
MTQVSDLASVITSGLTYIDALLDTGPGWNYLIPATNSLSYTFSIASGNETGVTNQQAFSTAQKNATLGALSYISNLTGISFNETTDGSAANIHFCLINIADTSTTGLCSWAAGYSYDGSNTITEYTATAYVYLDNVEWLSQNNDLTPGGNGYETLLHEMGHALGLKHPFEGSPILPSSQDNTANTLMSYTTNGGPYSLFSPYDIAALNWIYGADGLGGTLGINSSGGGRYWTGSSDANLITAGSSNDLLKGEAGNDTLTGGVGNDTIQGGGGNDLAIFSDTFASYTYSYDAGSDTFTLFSATSGTDSVTGVETFQFSDLTKSASQLQAENTPLVLDSLSPADNAVTVAPSADLTLTFNQTIQAGTGDFILFNADGTIAQTIAITDSSQVSISGSTVMINPGTDLTAGNSYYVNMAADVVKNLAGNSFAGISGTTAYNFTIANNSPTLSAFAAPVASGNEDSEITIGFADLKNQGNEADTDGTVDGFAIKAISSGSLKIGATEETAAIWDAASNYTVDTAHNAYWTPDVNANGTLNAFTAVALDNAGAESTTAIQVTVAVTAINDRPALTTPTTINYTDTVFDDTFATVTGSLVASDSNPLTYSIIDGTSNGGSISKSSAYGVLTINKTTGAYSFAAKDSAIEALTIAASTNFTVTASDGVLTDSKTLTVDINQTGTTESVGNDTLTGTSGNDKFDGLAGNDTIDGNTGADTMIGGLGNDVYFVDDGNDVVTETSALKSGIDTVNSSISYTLGDNLENLTLLGTEAINGTGNALKNILTGNAAANSLDGGLGSDRLIGGLGNDSYYIDRAGDVVTETSTSETEIDTVNSSISYLLGANLENLILTGTAALRGKGNAFDNVLTGNTGANKLDGGAGADTLVGGLGKDSLTGGLDADTFSFTAEAETGITASTRDIIVDFNRNQGDKIDLAAIDADTASVDNDVFLTLTVGGTFSGAFTHPGELYFDKTKHILYGNNDADSVADFSIQLTGVSSLTDTDLVL